MDKFSISEPLLATTRPLASLKLCEARLHLDARWPWVVLIPRKVGARELEHLSPADRAVLMDEIVAAGAAVKGMGAAAGRPVEKINVGALGNVAPQLHVHVVGRRSDDPAWPGPVWGFGQATPYDEAALETAAGAAAVALGPLKAAS